MRAPRVPAPLASTELLDGRSNSLRMRDGLPLDDWIGLGRRIATIAGASGWWLGDWLLYGQHTYGSRYKIAIVSTTLDYQTLRNCAWVAHKFEPSRRRETLSFNHHAEVASLPEPEQNLWLQRAERYGWSRNQLRRHVSAARRRTRDQSHDAIPVTVRLAVTSDQIQRWRDAAAASGHGLSDWIACVVDDAADALLLEHHACSEPHTIEAGATIAMPARRALPDRTGG
jgi:hypothetical protein